MTNADVYDAITEIFRDVLFRDDVDLKPEYSQDDVEGWDSQSQVEILISLEERFGIRFSSQEIDKIKTIADIASLVSTKSK